MADKESREELNEEATAARLKQIEEANKRGGRVDKPVEEQKPDE
jgi:hypothetical protein